MRDKRKTLDKKSENLRFKKIAKKQKLQERGITLIALVVTIVILLILAGVTLNIALSDNGLFSKTKEAAKKYQTESEREALEMLVMSYKLGSNTEDENAKLGKELLDRNLKNSSTWNMIVDESNDKRYGTGWYYIEKGQEIEGFGKAKNSFVINYETGEVIELEEDNYISLSAGDMLAVKDDLIINVDSSIIDKDVDNTKESLQEQLGDGVELVGFDFDNDNENSGLTNESFNFDGVNDYIKVQYNSEEEKTKLADNGFTFEFYGTWNLGSYYYNGAYGNDGYGGLFCYWNGNEGSQARLRFGFKTDGLLWNAHSGNHVSDWCEDENKHNIFYNLGKENLEDKIYITVTVDTSDSYKVEGKEDEFYKQRVYLNGVKKLEGNYNKENWKYFVDNALNECSYFCIGRSSMNHDGKWNYSKMKVYCLRLYNRALSEEEVNANYEKATKYHELIEQEI